MIKVYKTFEIDDSLWQQIADGFNESFEGHHATIDSLKYGFCVKNQWGYAYHAVAFDDKSGEVMGFNTYSPTLYINDLHLFLAGSTFVRKKYRKDIFLFMDMIDALKDVGLKEGFVAGLGVPNHNSLDYSLKFLGANLIGYLDYYILPVKPSKCLSKSFLKPIDYISKCIFKFHIHIQLSLTKLFRSREREVKYSLVADDVYFQVRFNSTNYQEYNDGIFRGFYRIVDENGVKTAYLMDFREKNLRTNLALAKVVDFILQREQIDAILFVGLLRLKQLILLKVPKRYIPKPLPITFGIFKDSDMERYKDMIDINNWNFSLMNFDVR